MDRRIAELLMKEFMALTDPLNAATRLTAQIGDKSEELQFRRGIGQVMDTVYVDLMRPIIRQYPDLDPDK